MTELNAEQLGIMSKVRDRMHTDFEQLWRDDEIYRNVSSVTSRFICENIERVALEKFGMVKPSTDNGYAITEKSQSVADALKVEICKAMHTQYFGEKVHHATMFVYLRWAVRGFENMDTDTQHYYAQLARLAWLDRIVDTGVIA